MSEWLVVCEVSAKPQLPLGGVCFGRSPFSVYVGNSGGARICGRDPSQIGTNPSRLSAWLGQGANQSSPRLVLQEPMLTPGKWWRCDRR
jgi:hypothetical protein